MTSTLVPLPPINVGSYSVESLSSYIERLANVYRVPVWFFIKEMIQPRFTKSYLRDEKTLEILGKKSRSINGISGWPNEISKLVSELCGLDSLSKLTMLSCKDVLPVRGLLYKSKRWCPYCYEDMKKTSIPIYDPLIWFIEPIELCPNHKIKLLEKCPFCQQNLQVLERYSSPGYCSYCSCWLGDEFPNEMKIKVESQSQDWTCSQISNLLVCASENNFVVDRKNISNFISLLIEEIADGSTWEFSKLISCHHKTATSWATGEQLPEFRSLCFLSELSNVSIVNIFTNNFNQITQLSTFPDKFLQNSKKPRKNNLVSIERKLNDVIMLEEYPPPSVKKISELLCCDLSFLIKKFPYLCNHISQRYKLFKSEEKEKLKQKNINDVVSAVENLIQEGIYPSVHETGKRLYKPGLMRCKYVIEAYYSTIERYSRNDDSCS